MLLLLALLLQEPSESPPFEAALRPEAGIDTNLLGVDVRFPVLESLKRRSFYGGATALGRYWLSRPDPWGLTVDATETLRAFSADPDLNYSDTLVSVTGWGPTDRVLSGGARIAFAEAITNGDGHYRTLRDASIGSRWKPEESWHLDVAISVTNVDYYLDLPDPQDRDGAIYQLFIAPTFDLGEQWNISPSLTFSRSSSEGSDFDNRAVTSAMSLTAPTIAGFRTSLGLSTAIARYDHDNSVAGYADARRDFAWGTTLTVSRRIDTLFGWTPSISIAYSNQSSNINSFDYDRWTISFGIGIPFIGDLFGE